MRHECVPAARGAREGVASQLGALRPMGVCMCGVALAARRDLSCVPKMARRSDERCPWPHAGARGDQRQDQSGCASRRERERERERALLLSLGGPDVRRGMCMRVDQSVRDLDRDTSVVFSAIVTMNVAY